MIGLTFKVKSALIQLKAELACAASRYDVVIVRVHNVGRGVPEIVLGRYCTYIITTAMEVGEHD